MNRRCSQIQAVVIENSSSVSKDVLAFYTIEEHMAYLFLPVSISNFSPEIKEWAGGNIENFGDSVFGIAESKQLWAYKDSQLGDIYLVYWKRVLPGDISHIGTPPSYTTYPISSCVGTVKNDLIFLDTPLGPNILTLHQSIRMDRNYGAETLYSLVLQYVNEIELSRQLGYLSPITVDIDIPAGRLVLSHDIMKTWRCGCAWDKGCIHIARAVDICGYYVSISVCK